MEKGRKLIIAIGLVVFVFIGWVTWITFISPASIQMNESPVSSEEMILLRHDLTVFIADRLTKERPGAQLKDITLSSPLSDNGKIKVPYVLTFKEVKGGTTATVQATALLEHAGAKYKVTQVIPQKETITYDDSDGVIKSESSTKK